MLEKVSFYAEPLSEAPKLPLFFYALVVFFWFGMIYAPVDTYVTHDEVTAIQRQFEQEMLTMKRYDVGLLVMAIFILTYFPKASGMTLVQKVFLGSTTLAVLISLLNPNNTLRVHEYFFAGPLVFYLGIILAFALFRLEASFFRVAIERIFQIGTGIILIRCVQALVLFFGGRGMNFFGIPCTISTADTLYIAAMFQVILFGAFLNTKRKLFLLIMAVFLVTMFLSYRRSALLVSLIGDLVLLLYYSLREGKGMRVALATGVVALAGVIALPFLPAEASRKMEDYALRFAGAFSFFVPTNFRNADFTDSGHVNESLMTTQTMLDNLHLFWGAGYFNKPFFVQGQTPDMPSVLGGIHNSFVLAWATWGLYMTVYLLLLLFLALYMFWRTVRLKPPEYFVFAVGLYLVMELVMGYFNGYTIMNDSRYFVRFVVLFAGLRLAQIEISEVVDSDLEISHVEKLSSDQPSAA